MADRVAAVLAEQRQRIVGAADRGQREAEVRLDPHVAGRHLRRGLERLLGLGPPPLQVVAVPGVVPDLDVVRVELERLLVVHLGLREPAEPVEGVGHPAVD